MAAACTNDDDPRPTIFFASDHGAAATLRRTLMRAMLPSCRKVVDLGTRRGDERVDYPEYARALTDRILDGPPGTLGVAICGTGIGMSIAANKVPGIRAALVHDEVTACMARRHNNANVLCFGARIVDAPDAVRLVGIFLDSSFEGGRHARRNAQLELSATETIQTEGGESHADQHRRSHDTATYAEPSVDDDGDSRGHHVPRHRREGDGLLRAICHH